MMTMPCSLQIWTRVPWESRTQTLQPVIRLAHRRRAQDSHAIHAHEASCIVGVLALMRIGQHEGCCKRQDRGKVRKVHNGKLSSSPLIAFEQRQAESHLPCSQTAWSSLSSLFGCPPDMARLGFRGRQAISSSQAASSTHLMLQMHAAPPGNSPTIESPCTHTSLLSVK